VQPQTQEDILLLANISKFDKQKDNAALYFQFPTTIISYRINIMHVYKNITLHLSPKKLRSCYYFSPYITATIVLPFLFFSVID